MKTKTWQAPRRKAEWIVWDLDGVFTIQTVGPFPGRLRRDSWADWYQVEGGGIILDRFTSRPGVFDGAAWHGTRDRDARLTNGAGAWFVYQTLNQTWGTK